MKIKMDMYQKREMRKNKKMNEDTKSLPSTSINWYPGHMAKTKREIEAYIQNLDVPKYDNSMTFLSTYYFGDRFNDDKLEVYVWVLYEEYTDNSGELKLEQSSSIPYLINIDTSSNEYKIIGYETPRDGNEYKKSIDKMFPITIRNRILMFQKSNEYKKMHQEHQKLIDIYKEYNEGE